jgi:Spy/CpxP family protein refolding chaperone
LEKAKRKQKISKRRTKMKKITLTVMALLFVAAVATSAFGFGWGRGPGFGGGPCARGDFGGYAGVELTADQKAKLSEMQDGQFKEIKPLREQMWTKRDELRKLWLETTPDQAKITAAQKEMRSLRDQMQDKMTAFRLNAVKVLTPEQQEKMRTAASSRGFGPGHGMGRGGWSGGCQGGPGGRW